MKRSITIEFARRLFALGISGAVPFLSMPVAAQMTTGAIHSIQLIQDGSNGINPSFIVPVRGGGGHAGGGGGGHMRGGGGGGHIGHGSGGVHVPHPSPAPHPSPRPSPRPEPRPGPRPIPGPGHGPHPFPFPHSGERRFPLPPVIIPLPTGPIPVPGPNEEPSRVFTSPDGSRAVWVRGWDHDAFLYDLTQPPGFEAKWLEWDVANVNFVMDANGQLAEIELQRFDGQSAWFDRDGNASGPIDQPIPPSDPGTDMPSTEMPQAKLDTANKLVHGLSTDGMNQMFQ